MKFAIVDFRGTTKNRLSSTFTVSKTYYANLLFRGKLQTQIIIVRAQVDVESGAAFFNLKGDFFVKEI